MIPAGAAVAWPPGKEWVMDSSSWAHRAMAAAWILASTAAQANSYVLTDLGAHRIPVGLNDRNEIVAVDRAHGARIALVWRGGRWHELDKPHEPIVAIGIDRRGDVAGNGNDGQAALWTKDGAYHAVDARAGAATTALSDKRTVVGIYVNRHGLERCFSTSWQQQAIDIGLPDPGATACQPAAVNDAGWIAGSAEIPGESGVITRAWIWRSGVFQDLGSLSQQFVHARATAMNRAGHVVGASETDAMLGRAFLWDGTGMRDIGESDRFPDTAAGSISNRGEIVGDGLDAQGQQHALRFADDAVIDLQDEVTNLGAMVLNEALAVNDGGVIIGIGTLDGQTHGVVLMPK
jgi:probable HAF family extracellular repeat protein